MSSLEFLLAYIVLPAAAFFAGAVPFSYFIARFFAGIDIREHGSGNPGASNVFRVVGPGPGILTFLLDATKAAACIVLAYFWLSHWPARALVWYEILLGVLAVLGHVFSPFLGFRGGKGVAAVIGVYLVLFPLGLIAGALSGLVAAFVFRYFSLGSLIGVLILPLSYFLLQEQPWHPANRPLLYLSLLAVLIVYARHTDNIKRLLAGKEHGMIKAPGR